MKVMTKLEAAPMLPLTLDERQLLLDLVSKALETENPTTRERFNALSGLLFKIRGQFP